MKFTHDFMRLRLLGVGASDGTYIKSAQINKSEILTYRDRFFLFHPFTDHEGP